MELLMTHRKMDANGLRPENAAFIVGIFSDTDGCLS